MRWSRLGFIALAVVVVGGVACGGDDDPTGPPSETVVGKWVGAYGNEDAKPANDYTFFFADDSTVGVIDGLGEEADVEAHGTWTVVGDTVRTTYTYDSGGTYSTEAVLTKSRTRMTGTWGEDPSVTDGGKLTLKQQ
jgi:hypothetical protein